MECSLSSSGHTTSASISTKVIRPSARLRLSAIFDPMRYFAGFLIEGEAATWHNTLVQDIAARFGTADHSKRLPPHITLYFTPELKDPTAFKACLAEWASQQEPFAFQMKGFGNVANKSIFSAVNTDESTASQVAEARHALRDIEPDSTPHNSFPWHPRASLARAIEPGQFQPILNYLSSLPTYDFPLVFDKLTLLHLEGDRYVVDEEFPFKNSARIQACFPKLFATPSGK